MWGGRRRSSAPSTLFNRRQRQRLQLSEQASMKWQGKARHHFQEQLQLNPRFHSQKSCTLSLTKLQPKFRCHTTKLPRRMPQALLLMAAVLM